MPLAACPKCSTNLRVPDGATGAVRCPKCATVFQPAAPPPSAVKPKPKFEVVDDIPPKAKPPASAASPRPSASAAVPKPAPLRSPAPPAPKSASKPAFDFDAAAGGTSKKPPKRVTAREADDEDDEDDEDDDRPRKKRRRDEDDDDDRPRGRRRGRDDDEDDDDDRPRKKKRRRDDDEDDDYDDRPAKGGVPGAAAAKVGMLMLSISLGLYLLTFALFGLLLFIGLLGAEVGTGLLIVPGLLGLANWVVGLIGLGFCIAGPSRSRGLAIAATAVAAVHLVLGFVVANQATAGLFSTGTVQFTSQYNRADRLERLSKEAQKNPDGPAAKELREEFKDREGLDLDDLKDPALLGTFMRIAGNIDKEIKRDATDELAKELEKKSQMRWQDVGTLTHFADKLLVVLSYQSKLFNFYVLGLLAGLTEVARVVLLVLLIGSTAKAVKAPDAAGKAKIGVISVAIAAGVAMLIAVLISVILDSNASSFKSKMEKGADAPPPSSSSKETEHPSKSFIRGQKNWLVIGDLLLTALHGAVLILPALAALQASSAAGRKARGR